MNQYPSRVRKDDDLPAWFVRPKKRGGIQATLFPEDVHEVLARLKISPDDLARWDQNEWVSFDSNTTHLLGPEQIHEIIFVRDLVRSGLPDAFLKVLLEQLPKPLAVDPNQIAFSFTHGWVLPAFTREPDLWEHIEENVEAWLDQLAEDGQNDRLVELREKIGALIASTDDSDEEESEA